MVPAGVAINIEWFGRRCGTYLIFKAFIVRGIVIGIPDSNQKSKIKSMGFYCVKKQLPRRLLARPPYLNAIIAGFLCFITKLVRASFKAPVGGHDPDGEISGHTNLFFRCLPSLVQYHSRSRTIR